MKMGKTRTVVISHCSFYLKVMDDWHRGAFHIFQALICKLWKLMTNLSLTTKLGIPKLLTQEMRNLGGTSDKLRKIL